VPPPELRSSSLRALAVGLRSLADRAAAGAAMLLLMSLMATVLLGVITRAIGEPFIWTDEVSRLLMVWLAGFGWILACRKHGHIRIRFFRDLLPPRAWRMAEIAMQLAVAAFGILILWFGSALVLRNFDLQATTIPIAVAWIYVPICLAGLVTLAQALGEIGELLQSVAKPDPENGMAP
jgi:TRAP-type C4-dicarboxylate transport system permease small subunit